MFHKKLLHVIFGWACVLLLAGCSMPGAGGSSPTSTASSSGRSGPCANPLYPVAVGVAWNYQMSGTTSDTFTRAIQSVDSSGFTDQDTFSNGVTRTGKWNCAAGDLTALDPVGDTTANVQFNGTNSDFQTTALSGVTLPAHVLAGDTWTQSLTLTGTTEAHGVQANSTSDVTISCSASGSESVTVPAGTFDAMKVACQDGVTITVTTSGVTLPVTINFSLDSWYAPGVGWVKSVGSGSGFDTTIELISYTIP
jgi:hypothetical protein